MNGLVLAGGRGSRMGVEKGALLHPDGRTMLGRTVYLLREAGCERVVVSLRDGQVLERIDGVEMIKDKGEGPLGGMIAVMEGDVGADWLVVACDLPRLEVRVLKGLLGFSERFVVYGKDGQLEPLCGFYGNGAVGILKESRDAGEWGLQKILRSSGVRVLELEDERALENANTPGDWERSLEG
jgi:molybdopterin-guanine dinucleotide biosynthesis protein A